MPVTYWTDDEVEQHTVAAVSRARQELIECVADEVIYEVVNLPDRTSPDDWPEAMLVTADELKRIINDAITAERS